ncbi:hypothetical protein BpHYR1_004110 [Brachionus plicatilis]|uniref:Uncharacterized protein n=1 Tax=Brachionus plicatilis TaxID=10195 RepID=A0A3M7R0R2_BRAPC|nr:hypothetical protein BpHYR1_004110 [Brachionus plicatilis]
MESATTVNQESTERSTEHFKIKRETLAKWSVSEILNILGGKPVPKWNRFPTHICAWISFFVSFLIPVVRRSSWT